MLTLNRALARVAGFLRLPLPLQFPDRELQAALNAVIAADLSIVTLGLGLLFAISGLAPLVLEPGGLHAQVVFDVAVGVALLIAAAAFARFPPRRDRAPRLAFGIMALALSSGLHQLWVTDDVAQTTIIMIVVIGAGALILSPGWLSALFAVAWGGWSLLVERMATQREFEHYFFAMLISTAVACLIYLERVSGVRRSEAARSEAACLAEELAASNEQFNSILNNLDDLLWSTSLPSNELLYINRAATQTYGWSAEELRANPRLWADIFPAEDRAVVAEQRSRVLASGESLDVEHRIVRSNGEIRWLHSRLRLARVGGHPVRLDGIATDITDRRRAEARSRNLAAAVEASAEGVILTDATGTITDVNPAFESLTGFSRAEAIGQNPRILKSGQHGEAFYREMWDVLARGEVWRGRMINRRRDGTLYHAEGTIAPIRDARGKTGAFVGVQLDVSERVRAEEELRRRLAFEGLVTGLSSHFISLDPEEVDEAIDSALGSIGSFAEVDRAYVFRFVAGGRMSNTHEWCAPGVDPQISNLQGLRTEMLPWWTVRIRRAETIHIPVVSELPPAAVVEREILEPQGICSLVAVPMVLGKEVTGFLGFDSKQAEKLWTDDDVALLRILGEIVGAAIGRKEAEEARRKSEQVYRALFDRTRDAIFILDMQGRHVGVNQQASGLLGFSREELLNLAARDVVVPEEYDESAGRMAALRGGAELPVYERTFRRKDGSRVRVEINAAMVRDVDGAPLHFQSIVRDITARKQAEEALQRSAEQLRAYASEIAEANSALAVARDEAVQASRLKSHFLAMVSHELRTPLNAVIGLNELLLDTPLDEQQREWVRIAQDSGTTLLALINDLLDLSKIEAGKLELQKALFAPRKTIDVALALIASAATAKGLALSASVDPQLPERLSGDPTRIQQMLSNLLSNAVKFTDAGEIQLIATSRAVADSLHEVHVSVRDTGSGIAPEHLGRLFETFTQLDASIHSRYGGTGLGLAITRHLAEMMGGRAWVESQLRTGSTFHFTFLAEAAAPESPEERPPALADAELSDLSGIVSKMALTHPLRILLTEDNPINQTVGLGMLERLGYRADLATDGHVALEMVLQQTYDMVLLDIEMPGMDGLEVASAVRQTMPVGRRPRLVAMTAHALSGDRERFLAAGMDDYLDKPVRLRSLAAVLSRCVPVGTPTAKDTSRERPRPEDPVLPNSLDAEMLAELRELMDGGSPGGLRDLVEVFFDQADAQLAALENALREANAAHVADAAHSLASSSGNMAALRLCQLCKEAAARSRGGDLSCAAADLSEIRAEYGRVRAALVATLLEGTGGEAGTR